MPDIQTYLEQTRARVERELDAFLPPASLPPVKLHKAVRYSVFPGGKRIRPILCLAACHCVGGAARSAILPALAVELLHSYTLIHDDLPCMDDDDFRRGKPSCHAAFGEATAVLAGDALQALSFRAASLAPTPRRYPRNRLVMELADAAGTFGVVGGQALEMEAIGRKPDRAIIKRVHYFKTASLFRAAVRMGAIAGNANRNQLDALTGYAVHLGLAFQLADDILDAAEENGEGHAGKRKKQDKFSAVKTLGRNAAAARANSLAAKAVAAVKARRDIGAERLVALAEYLLKRTS